MNKQTSFHSPLGAYAIRGSENFISEVKFTTEKIASDDDWALGKLCISQLQEYFEGKRTEFVLPLEPKGTTFQKKIWKNLEKIPYGKTISYEELAMMAGSPKGCRAAGQANNRNPISIIVPCHRVIGKNGDLTGYASGIENKKFLLNLEKQYT